MIVGSDAGDRERAASAAASTTTRRSRACRRSTATRWQIRLNEPYYNFIYNLADCRVSCAVAREVVEHYGDDIGAHPVGTGPYRLAFWKRASRIVLEANPDFREEYFDARGDRDDVGREILRAA